MSAVDWNAPLEAVSVTTGHRAIVVVVEMCDDGTEDRVIAGVPDGFEVFKPDGMPWVGHDGGCNYRIENAKARS